MTDSLSRPISISISIHVGLLAVMFLKMSFFPAEPIQIRRAMRVDIVGAASLVLGTCGGYTLPQMTDTSPKKP